MRCSSKFVNVGVALQLSGRIGHEDLDALCREMAVVHALREPTLLRCDLRRLELFDPSTLALFIATMRSLRHQRICDPSEDYHPPGVQELERWLGSDAFEHLVASAAGRGATDGGGIPTPRRCEPFIDGGGITRAITSLQLAAEDVWHVQGLQSFGAMVADMAENVLQHSGAPGGGVAAVGVDPVERRISLAIADCGVGIRSSLIQNPAYQDVPDDLSAILTAISPGATSDPGAGGGVGLFLARLVLQENGGSFFIRSGDAAFQQGKGAFSARRLPYLPGTVIAVEAQTDRIFDYARIDHWLEQPSGLSFPRP